MRSALTIVNKTTDARCNYDETKHNMKKLVALIENTGCTCAGQSASLLFKIKGNIT
jgi:hypothetical protein